MSDQRSPLVSEPDPTSGTPQVGIVWLFIGIVVLAVAVPLIRAEVKLHRRAALELPDSLTGSALRRARRRKLADLRYLSRPLQRPAGNISDASGPGTRAEAKSLCDLVGGERAVRLAGVAAQCGGDVGDPGQT